MTLLMALALMIIMLASCSDHALPDDPKPPINSQGNCEAQRSLVIDAGVMRDTGIPVGEARLRLSGKYTVNDTFAMPLVEWIYMRQDLPPADAGWKTQNLCEKRRKGWAEWHLQRIFDILGDFAAWFSGVGVGPSDLADVTSGGLR